MFEPRETGGSRASSRCRWAGPLICRSGPANRFVRGSHSTTMMEDGQQVAAPLPFLESGASKHDDRIDSTSGSSPHRRQVAPVRDPQPPDVRLRRSFRCAGAVPQGPGTDGRTDWSLADHDASGRYGHFPVDHHGRGSHRAAADADPRGAAHGAGWRRVRDDRKPASLLVIVATIGVLSPADKEVGPFLSIEQAALSQTVPDERRTAVFAWYNLAGSRHGGSGGTRRRLRLSTLPASRHDGRRRVSTRGRRLLPGRAAPGGGLRRPEPCR